MAEHYVCPASEFKEGERQIVRIGKDEIGIFRHEGKYYAYSNYCLHQGGPACEGLTIARVVEKLRPDQTSMGLDFHPTDMHFACPWHGYEYDLRTGEKVADRRLRLRKYATIEKEDSIYVVV